MVQVSRAAVWLIDAPLIIFDIQSTIELGNIIPAYRDQITS
jgi:hypothetical protein